MTPLNCSKIKEQCEAAQLRPSSRLRKNTKFGNRISLDSSGKSAPIAGSKNSIITARIRKAHFSAAC
jgi:hypothetical protein